MFITQLKIAYRSVLRNRRKTLVTFFAVCFGTASIIIAGGFFNYMFYALHAAAVYGQYGHIQVYAHGFMEKGVVSPFSYIIEDFNEFNLRYSKLPHVRFIMPRTQFSGLISNGDTTGSFIGLGVDTAKEGEMSSFSIGSGPAIRITSGRYLREGDKNVIIIGKGLSAAIGAKAGERVTLLTNTESGSINGVTVEVAGIFESFQKEFDDRAIQMPIETTQNLLRIGNKFQTAVFLVEDSFYVDSTVNLLNETFLNNGEQYEIRTWESLAIFHNASVALFSRIFLVINIVIAIIVVLGIANSISMSIFERTREIGTIMAIGTKPNQVVMQYLLEGIIIGVFGGIAGIVVGVIVAKIASIFGIPMPPPPGATRPWVAKVTPPLLIYIRAFATVSLAGAIASLYPAIRASRLRIVDALRQT